MTGFVLRVPASSANLGPGFDSLGLALALYNTVVVESPASGLEIEIEGEGLGVLPSDANNLVIRAARARCETRNSALPGMRIRMVNGIPVGAGLGSSAAAALAGMALADVLANGEISKEDLLGPAFELEGHPDNAAAALFGGLVLVTIAGGRPISRRVPIPELMVALALPDLKLPTQTMRRALPKTVSLKAAASNIGLAALTVEALRHEDYDLLAQVSQDHLHPPHRKSFIPGFDRVVDAGKQAGAAAVVLSGAGPSLVAFAADGHAAIAEAMVEAFKAVGLEARSLILGADMEGLTFTQNPDAAQSEFPIQR